MKKVKVIFSILLLAMSIGAFTFSIVKTGQPGEPGIQGEQGPQGSQGEPGKDGISVVSITLTKTEGNIDTYTVLYSDNTSTTFTVTNGKDGVDGEQGIQGIQGEPGKDGKAPVITIQEGYWFIDGKITGIRATGLKGDPGKGISNISLKSSVDLVDTYEITYTDGTKSTFIVTNGKDGVDGEQGIQGIQGEPGKDGHTPVITIQEGYWYIDGVSTGVIASGIQGEIGTGISSIKYTSSEDLVDIYTIIYTDGTTSIFTVTNGKDGADGAQGIQGEPGKDGHTPVITIQEGYWYIDGKATGVSATGIKGDPGRGISNISLKSSVDLVDTYEITYSDGTKSTFTVTNGKDGADGAQGIQGIQGEPGKDGHTPVITIQEGYWYIDGVSTGVIASGIDGEIGVGISSIELTKTLGLVDTYTITYTDGTKSTFTVTNGKDGVDGEQGIQGIQGEPGKDGHTPVITIQDGYWYIDGVSTGVIANGINGEMGVGISSIELTKTLGLVDTYTITYTDGTKSTFTVTNGKDGVDGAQGIQGIQGEPGKDGHTPIITIQNGKWYIDGVDTTVKAEGLKGDTGRGISDISLKSTENLIDTYEITYTDGTKSTFTITNGKDGEDGAKGEQGIQGVPGKDGHTPVITIVDGYWYIDGATTGIRAEGLKGDAGVDGRSILSISLTEQNGLMDTYTILYSDNTTTTFVVMNGAQGIQGVQGIPGKDGHTPVITVGSNGNWYVDEEDSGVKAQGIQGETGLSAYEIYIKYHPEYTGSEKQWIHDFIAGRLETDIWYVVSFDSNGGTEVDSQLIMEGRKANMPTEPIRDGYIFEGWYYKGEKWSFIGYDVTDDIELVAKWQEVYTEGLLFITLEDGTYGVSTSYTKFYKEIIIPSYYYGTKVTAIFTEGFKGCSDLKTVKLPETLTHIQDSAFSGCVSLEEVNLPDALIYLGEYAFSGCKKLHTVSIGSNLDTISAYAFNGCNELKTLNIPESVKTIRPYAFYGCTNLENLSLEGEVTWTCSNTTFYSQPYNIDSYPTDTPQTFASKYEKTFTIKVADSSSFINIFAKGHSNTFKISGYSPYYFIWYYMQNWTRS